MKIGNYESDFDPLEKAQETAEKASSIVSRVDSYLYGEFSCPDCGGPCEATTAYSSTLCEEVKAWHCGSCDTDYYRENVGSDRERRIFGSE